MRFAKPLRRFWPEMLLSLAVTLPWLSLFVVGLVWLWRSGYVWVWAIGAAAVGLLAWPLSVYVQRRAKEEARVALGDLAAPARDWNVVERDAWAQVLVIADTAAPVSFTEIESILASAREIVEAVARSFHPNERNAWARFSLPEFLLLAERLSRDVRREALRHIPAVRAVKLSHLLWVHRQNVRYGAAAQTGWRLGFGLWRVIRAALNPLQAAGQETSGAFFEKTTKVLSYRARAYATRMLILEIGRAAIDLYSGRLAQSDRDLRSARELDMGGATAAPIPVRIVLIGQVNSGKSSLLNALAQETRCAVGPVPTTPGAAEYLLKQEGRPILILVDMPGIDERADRASEWPAYWERADLIMWVASATQTAREPDRKRLEDFRAWASAQVERRPPPLLLALTHVDELRPATEWAPPYDLTTPTTPKARMIIAAMNAAARALGLRVDEIVPVALPSARETYNIESLWARIAVELDEAKLVQLDRLRLGGKGISLRELVNALGHAGRTIIKGIVKA